MAHTQAPKVVMGPGTGLGAAQLMWDDAQKAYRVWPGEMLPCCEPDSPKEKMCWGKVT